MQKIIDEHKRRHELYEARGSATAEVTGKAKDKHEGKNVPKPPSGANPNYKEPSREEMKNLFKGVPLPKNFKDVTETVTVLPISLENFYKLFYSNDAINFNDTYIEYS